MAYALAFLLGGVGFVAVSVQQTGPLQWLAVWTGLSCLWVGAAYAAGQPQMFGKAAGGRLHPAAWLALAPYHLFNEAIFGCSRWRMAKPAAQYTEVAPNLFLGRRLVGDESRTPAALAWRGVLDLTCEFTESHDLRQRPGYRCLPVLDGVPPSVAELQSAVAWLVEQLDAGPVYVHCALGRGRSATVVAAYLLQAGLAEDVAAAVASIRAKRRIALHARHLRRLEEFRAGCDLAGGVRAGDV